MILRTVSLRAVHKPHAIVCGGGFAGISAAIALSSSHTVHLVAGQADSRSQEYGASLQRIRLDPYQGLWTSALQALELISPGILQLLEKQGR